MKYCMWYALAQLMKNKIMAIITTAMVTLGFILVGYAGVTYARFHNAELVAKKTTDYDIENIYNINFFKYVYAYTEEKEQLRELYYYIKELPDISFCGFYFYSENELYITPELGMLCGLTLAADENVNSAWTGANMADAFPAGKKLQGLCNYTVQNVLPEGSVFWGDGFIDSDGLLVNLDNYIVMDADKLIREENVYITNGIINNFYFCVADLDNIEQVKQDIKNKADELGLDIYGINSLDILFERQARDAMDMAGEDYYMPIVLFICSCIGIVLATLISYKVNRHDTNIMLMNGFTRRDISWIFLFENGYKSVAAFAIMLLYWLCDKSAVEYSGNINMVPLLLGTAVLGIVLIWVSSLPVIIKLKLNLPVSLVGEEE
ncbi:MAG: hypothetical protein NC225_03835 [Clostridium sp.]|nr:hypothetical protein [Clostridium sp.]MCM1398597.1 hypothetical protein [Clostridium sp.]MCM1459885.1 hypothetical protein [Bacteroides sp.]